MTTEDLLKPRWKVIADYPDSTHELGDILDRNWCRYKFDDEDTGEIIWQISDFPHIFEPLPWWKEREFNEMPEYVKCLKTPDQKIMPGQVFKVTWAFTYAGRAATGQWIVVDTGCYEPATEADYNAYLQTTNKLKDGKD